MFEFVDFEYFLNIFFVGNNYDVVFFVDIDMVVYVIYVFVGGMSV